MNAMQSVLLKANSGDREAYAFLVAAKSLIEQMHEFCETKSTDHHRFIALCAMAANVYSLPFYIENADVLGPSLQEAFRTRAQQVLTDKQKE